MDTAFVLTVVYFNFSLFEFWNCDDMFDIRNSDIKWYAKSGRLGVYFVCDRKTTKKRHTCMFFVVNYRCTISRYIFTCFPNQFIERGTIRYITMLVFYCYPATVKTMLFGSFVIWVYCLGFSRLESMKAPCLLEI